ncbi:MAG TPA: A/G-specific adenine glycosylase [Ktedonobacterales bacterium]
MGQPTAQSGDSATPQADAGDHARRDAAWTRLQAWYAAEGRATLPWRHTRDPYAVLVSETMLQQTQVERVLPKYAEFLAQFPTLERLAAAPVAEVIQAWRGLGYNLRAVRLWRVARQVVAEHGGRLPQTVEGLMRLAGIGRYTAGAIACFAFGLPVATVDTNIRRVLWRVFRGIEPARWPEGMAAQRAALALAEWALPPDHTYDWQQALMDLGATVCISRRPACERCPLAGCCAAYAETARVALFPSGEVLARLRDERATLNAEHAEGRGGRGAQREGDGEREGREERAKDAKKERSGEQPQRTQRTPREVTDRKRSIEEAGGRRVAEGRAPYQAGRARKAQEPFERTSRYFRGRAVDALRALPPGATLPLAELGALIRPSYTAEDEPWLRTLVAGLVRDGLARVVEDGDHMGVGLP